MQVPETAAFVVVVAVVTVKTFQKAVDIITTNTQSHIQRLQMRLECVHCCCCSSSLDDQSERTSDDGLKGVMLMMKAGRCVCDCSLVPFHLLWFFFHYSLLAIVLRRSDEGVRGKEIVHRLFSTKADPVLETYEQELMCVLVLVFILTHTHFMPSCQLPFMPFGFWSSGGQNEMEKHKNTASPMQTSVHEGIWVRTRVQCRKMTDSPAESIVCLHLMQCCSQCTSSGSKSAD